MPKSYSFNKVVSIGRRVIGPGHPCFLIAEAGSNHNQKISWAKRLIDVAVRANADAVKFQTFVPEKIYVRKAGFADYLGHAKSIQEIFKDIMMPPVWIPRLAEYCRRKGILFMSSAFDEASVDLVDPYVPAHKIASYECTHLPLIRYVAKKGKPIILSTGMASLDEITAALNTIASTGNRNVVLMHCVAKYPAPIEHSNLRVIDTLRKEFELPVGLSDHSREPFTNPVAVVARGGNIVEKHFTLSNDLPGPDHRFALEPEDLKQLVECVRDTEAALGSPVKKVLAIEKPLFAFARRRVHAITDIRRGEKFTRANVAVLRSGKQRPGIEPSGFERLLSKNAARDIKEGEGVRKQDFR